jgi:hypothetical protein
VLALVLVPIAGILGLVGLDLLTGGDAHLIRTVVQGDGPGSFADVVERRTVISWRGLRDQTVLVLCVLGLVGFAVALWRRDRIYAPLRDHPIFMAGIWGGFAATILGALGNDSGPVIFAGGFLTLLLATGYVRGRPDRHVVQPATG